MKLKVRGGERWEETLFAGYSFCGEGGTAEHLHKHETADVKADVLWDIYGFKLKKSLS